MPRTQRTKLSALAALLAGAALGLPGCDNPACVFGGNCFGEGPTGAIGTAAASVPNNNEWLNKAVPTVLRVSPSSGTVDSRTPLVVVFSESMSSSGMSTLFLLTDSTGGPTICATSLIGDGRVLVLLPATPLTASGTFTLKYNPNGHVQDRNGQELVIPTTDTQLASVSVAASNTNVPKLVTTWPADNATNQGAKGEILAFFDRPLDELTLDSNSFHVQVNGANLVPPIEPTVLSLAGGLTTDSRVVRWRSVDSAGNPQSLGLDAAVTLELSPAVAPLTDEAGNSIAHGTIDFRTAPFGAPLASAITSQPSDAIGIDNISGPATLAVRVTFEGTQSGDKVDVFMIGTEPNVAQDPKLICLAREVALTTPFTDFTLTAQELDLAASGSPVKGRFADGKVEFAFQVVRGSIQSPVTLLDVDPLVTGRQVAELDTTRPVLLGLTTSGTVTASYSSDSRDLVVVGRASEAVRAAEVTCALGDNLGGGTSPPIVASSSGTGLFIAKPVALGLVDPAQMPLPFQLTIYDRALNSAGPLNSSYRQVGGVGPGNTSFTEIAVRVFDAYSLAPINLAQVYTHEWDFVGLTSVSQALTDANGVALIAASTTTPRTILTVQVPGYELFTFDGVTVDRVDVPLHPLADATATVEGVVSASVPQISLYTNLVADSRLDDPGRMFEPVNTCGFDAGTQAFDCPYDPYPILSRRVGAQSAFAIVPLPSILLYTPAAFLKAATLELPVPAAPPGAALINDQAHRHLLDEAGADAEDAAIDAPPQLLTTTFYPVLRDDPVVSVEATSPGMPGTVVVGVGRAFTDALPAGTFAVRAAYPGVVDGIQDSPTDRLGTLVTNGTIDPDLMLRMQVMDGAGNVGGVRPRFSTNPVAADPPAAADLGLVPMAVDPLGGADVLNFTDVLPDATGMPGLYRVVLTDLDGTRWVIWTTDPPDSRGPEVQVRLPYLDGIGLPLAPGDLECRIDMYAWPTLDPAAFLWSDVEREFDRFSHSTVLPVTPP